LLSYYLLVKINTTVFLFFFFQAEDGIRDFHVTGVQTCALPIFDDDVAGSPTCTFPATSSSTRPCLPRSGPATRCGTPQASCRTRSEERRVGKECRLRWATKQSKKKNIS